jgi:hypothetical protein
MRGWWVCVLLCASAGRAWAVQATLTGDAHVSAAQPTVNSGGLSNLNVGGGYTALMQFDVSSASVLPAGTTAAQVTRATLRVYCNRADVAGAVSVQTVDGTWNESTVTYVTMPALGSVVGSAQVNGAGGFITFDVTAAVQSWLSGSSANNGLALTASSAVVQFDSKENDQTAHAPELEIALVAGGGGVAGATGATGATGPQGLTGLQGQQGLTGAQGPAGVQGPQGATGATGVVGATGPVGSVGATGAAGIAGPAGASGASGANGATGATGAPGLIYQGAYDSTANYVLGDVVVFAGASYASLAAGNRGQTPGLSSGYWGLLSAQGTTGLTGATGATGTAGQTGALGAAGPAGEQGAQGAQGVAGQAGAQGIPGATGATGLQGPTGTTGPVGPVGLSFQGAYSSTANYALGDGVLWQGAGWVSLVAGNHGNTPDQSPGYWSMFAATGVAGAMGATGPQGATGVAGANGAVGAAGATGATGSTGAVGAPGLVYQGAYDSTANYALGDVVVFAGSSYVSLQTANHGQTPGLNLAWWGVLTAQGAAGPAGTTGPIGATGAAGSQGVAGPTGSQGPQGATGPQGPVGAQGLTGTSGPAGAVGPTGLQGVAGQAGAQGIQGAAGATGALGPAGPTGAAGSTGSTGGTGPVGAVGMNFRGAWSNALNYEVNDAVTYSGSTYLALSPGKNLEPDANTQFWMVIAQAGGAGPTGAAGTAASILVGTVTTLAAGSPAAVTNSGTANTAILNFSIPQGAQGAPGTSGSGSSTASGNFAAIFHAVSYATTYYAVNSPNASTNELGTAATTGVLAWVPAGCSATQLNVYSQQSGTIKVTLRVGTPGSMMGSTLACSVATNASCTATGAVTVAAGSFIDYEIDLASGTPAGVWTALTCQ